MAVRKIDTSLGDIHVINPDDDISIAYLRADVGALSKLRNPEHFLTEAIAGNRFCVETRGAVLSLDEDDDATIMLTLRTNPARLDDDDLRGVILSTFLQTLGEWRNRYALEPVADVVQETEGN